MTLEELKLIEKCIVMPVLPIDYKQALEIIRREMALKTLTKDINSKENTSHG